MDWVQRVWRCGAPIPARLEVDVARGADASDLVAALCVEVARGVHEQGAPVAAALRQGDGQRVRAPITSTSVIVGRMQINVRAVRKYQNLVQKRAVKDIVIIPARRCVANGNGTIFCRC